MSIEESGEVVVFGNYHDLDCCGPRRLENLAITGTVQPEFLDV